METGQPIAESQFLNDVLELEEIRVKCGPEGTHARHMPAFRIRTLDTPKHANRPAF
jgi:hypothetical protein